MLAFRFVTIRLRLASPSMFITLIDIRVFNPHSRSNRSAPHTIVYQRHEKEKRRHYEERVGQVEQASFVPVVMSASGGMGPASTALYKRIAHLLAENRGEHYSHVMAFVRCRISFSLLKSCIMFIGVVGVYILV